MGPSHEINSFQTPSSARYTPKSYPKAITTHITLAIAITILHPACVLGRWKESNIYISPFSVECQAHTPQH
jgi:hypothetical protein